MSDESIVSSAETPPPPFEAWAIVELMGHVRMAGKVTEEERFGSKLGRVDVPRDDGTFSTHYFGGGSVYRLTPTTEEIARSVAARNQPSPVHSWELPKQIEAAIVTVAGYEEYGDED